MEPMYNTSELNIEFGGYHVAISVEHEESTVFIVINMSEKNSNPAWHLNKNDKH